MNGSVDLTVPRTSEFQEEFSRNQSIQRIRISSEEQSSQPGGGSIIEGHYVPKGQTDTNEQLSSSLFGAPIFNLENEYVGLPEIV